MPDKNPSFWASIWVALNCPSWQGAIMATIISVLRVLYEGKETSKVRILLEALICGALSLSANSLIEWMDWPPKLAIAAGGAIGFLGVTAIRGIAMRVIGRKVDSV